MGRSPAEQAIKFRGRERGGDPARDARSGARCEAEFGGISQRVACRVDRDALATAALIGWEWLQREEAIFGAFDLSHYRPKDRPNTVRVLHPKTGEENWIPLFDESGGALYPEIPN